MAGHQKESAEALNLVPIGLRIAVEVLHAGGGAYSSVAVCPFVSAKLTRAYLAASVIDLILIVRSTKLRADQRVGLGEWEWDSAFS